MKGNFLDSFNFTMRIEGHDSDHPEDDGGRTRYGISSRYHPAMWENGPPTFEKAKLFYEEEFWNQCRCNELQSGVDIVVFDSAVPSGPSDAIRWLQLAVGAKPDALFGPKTLAAVLKTDPVHIMRSVTVSRIRHYTALEDFPTFGKGWIDRSLQCFAVASDMARKTPERDQEIIETTELTA